MKEILKHDEFDVEKDFAEAMNVAFGNLYRFIKETYRLEWDISALKGEVREDGFLRPYIELPYIVKIYDKYPFRAIEPHRWWRV
jgi:hypothetical protein